MPEGHSVHRIARQFSTNFVGKVVHACSPQGRFADGAALIDGRTMTDARAIGKHLFLQFEGSRFLHVHLGMYGAWDFAGEITTDPTIRSAGGRMGQTNQRGTFLDPAAPSIDDAPDESAPAGFGDRAPGLMNVEDSVASMGAPRRARMRMAESESVREDALEEFPPEPVGQVRVRLLTDTAVADLRGATECEIIGPGEVQQVLERLGPDPLVDPPKHGERRFIERASKTSRPIALVLMDQEIIAGIGNVYRAELLFRARLNPFTPANQLPTEVLAALWRDWSKLLRIGVETGQMMTIDRLGPKRWAQAMASRDERHWVYHRAGLPCRRCGTPIQVQELATRKLYWCPVCQA